MSIRSFLPRLTVLSYNQISEIFNRPTVNLMFTEKTDGFCFQVGFDEQGFFVRSATSVKMRNFGDFSKAAYEKFGKSDKYDPMISARLDLALQVLKNSYKLIDIIKRHKLTITGEMILIVDDKPYTPSGTLYDVMKLGTYGSFIIHTKIPENFHLSLVNLDKLISDGSSLSLSIDHDCFHDSHISVDIEHPIRNSTDYVQKLNDKLFQHLNVYSSKWGKGTKPEGYVIHVNPNFRFKVIVKDFTNAFHQ